MEIGNQTVDVRITTHVRLLVEKLQKLESPKLVMNPNVGCKLMCAPSLGAFADLAKSRYDTVRP